MASLATNHVDPEEAAANLVAVIRDEIPTASVSTEASGATKQPSFREALGHELSGYFRSKEPVAFAIRADWSDPRPLQVEVRYVQVGRAAGPLSILYLTRLGTAVAGAAAVRRKGSWPFAKAGFEGDADVSGALSRADGLGKAILKLLDPAVMIGTTAFTIEPFLEVIPDDDGAILAVFSAPARERGGFGAYRLALRSVLEVATEIEKTLGRLPGARQPARPGAPL
jgi:hypothetical protein